MKKRQAPLSFVKRNSQKKAEASAFSFEKSTATATTCPVPQGVRPTDVENVFRPAIAVAASRDGGETALNAAKLRECRPGDLDDLAEKAAALADSLKNWEMLARRIDPKNCVRNDVRFVKAQARLEAAIKAPNEKRRDSALASAVAAFGEAASSKTGFWKRWSSERKILAGFGCALAQFYLGELSLGLAALEAIALLFVEKQKGLALRSLRNETLALVVETRDLLSQLDGESELIDRDRDLVELRKSWTTNQRESERDKARRRALELASATELLANDLQRGAGALRQAANEAQGRETGSNAKRFGFAFAKKSERAQTSAPTFGGFSVDDDRFFDKSSPVDDLRLKEEDVPTVASQLGGQAKNVARFVVRRAPWAIAAAVGLGIVVGFLAFRNSDDDSPSWFNANVSGLDKDDWTGGKEYSKWK